MIQITPKVGLIIQNSYLGEKNFKRLNLRYAKQLKMIQKIKNIKNFYHSFI